jgi:DNA repair protein RadC
MSTATNGEWKIIKGLGSAKLAQIKAALEIGRRFRENEVREDRLIIRSSNDIVTLLSPQLRDLKKESFKTVFLDAKNVIIDIETSTQGTVNQAVPFVREIIFSALQRHAVALICSHNHPSGDPSPSIQDKQFTHELKKAASLMNIKMLDHIIIGNNKFYSFADEADL